jgi:hypothetical protein
VVKASFRVAAPTTLPFLVFLTSLLLLAGCAEAGPDTPAASNTTASRSLAPKTSVKPPAAAPSYPDVTQGDSSTAAMLYSFDATAHSAVIEPVIFMEGPSFCKKYRIRSSDGRCERDWVLVQSHQKAAVPVSPGVKLFIAESDTEDCVGSIDAGGSCPVNIATFSSVAAANKNDFLVHVTIKAGTVTRIAEEYRP